MYAFPLVLPPMYISSAYHRTFEYIANKEKNEKALFAQVVLPPLLYINTTHRGLMRAPSRRVLLLPKKVRLEIGQQTV